MSAFEQACFVTIASGLIVLVIASVAFLVI